MEGWGAIVNKNVTKKKCGVRGNYKVGTLMPATELNVHRNVMKTKVKGDMHIDIDSRQHGCDNLSFRFGEVLSHDMALTAPVALFGSGEERRGEERRGEERRALQCSAA